MHRCRVVLTEKYPFGLVSHKVEGPVLHINTLRQVPICFHRRKQAARAGQREGRDEKQTQGFPATRPDVENDRGRLRRIRPRRRP